MRSSQVSCGRIFAAAGAYTPLAPVAGSTNTPVCWSYVLYAAPLACGGATSAGGSSGGFSGGGGAGAGPGGGTTGLYGPGDSGPGGGWGFAGGGHAFG